MGGWVGAWIRGLHIGCRLDNELALCASVCRGAPYEAGGRRGEGRASMFNLQRT